MFQVAAALEAAAPPAPVAALRAAFDRDTNSRDPNGRDEGGVR
jgi:hypothetical protein